MTSNLVIIGAGIGGLCAALFLQRQDRRLTLLERDAAPPSGGADAAFKDWNRRGVGHLRHSHAFLARLRILIKDHHPQLLAQLMDAGCRELDFERMLTDLHRARYQPSPVDADLVVLTSRRTTLELVIRRYVEALPGVTIRPDCFVAGLEMTESPGQPVDVTGVRLESGEVITADLVVDTAGRTTGFIEDLILAGAAISETSESAGILYFTRHYRLNDGQSEPPRGTAPATGDLGYLKFGVFPGDNGCFSITLCVPEIEMEMRKAIVNPMIFDAVCRQMPGLVPWIDPDRATPVSKVFGMGDLHSRWRSLAPGGVAAVTGYVALGDALVRTNPLYGRGCSFAAVSAHLLAGSLDRARDRAALISDYQASIDREIGPYYQSMLTQDRASIRRARQTLTPGYRASLRSKLLKSFVEDAVGVAVRSDPDLLRAALRGFHMLEHPSDWLKRPVNLAKVMGYWARGKVGTRLHTHPRRDLTDPP